MPTYATNKKAKFDYEILDTIEAGLVLTGNEVKSIRSGGVNLKGAYITFHKNEAFITNLHVPKYKYSGNINDYDPERSKKILLKAREINYLREKSMEKGLTIVPISLYTKGRHIKVKIAVCKGKKKHDKRRDIKKRELDREIHRALKN